jgi:hypothetical protein
VSVFAFFHQPSRVFRYAQGPQGDWNEVRETVLGTQRVVPPEELAQLADASRAFSEKRAQELAADPVTPEGKR